MNEAFADAYFYIALLNPNDQANSEACSFAASIDRRVVTTLWVLMELADALSAPSVRSRTHRFIGELALEENTEIIFDVEPWFSRGLALFGKRSDKSWSLTDCISFEVMKSRGIVEALTADHHFAQAGFRPLMTPTTV